MRGTELDGEVCRVCPVEDPRMLRWRTFTDGRQVLCANHAALSGRRALSFDEFLAELVGPGIARAVPRQSTAELLAELQEESAA